MFKKVVYTGLICLFASQVQAGILYQDPVDISGTRSNCRFVTACVGTDIFGAVEFTLTSASTVGVVSFTGLDVGNPSPVATGIDWRIYDDGGVIPGNLISTGDNFGYSVGPSVARPVGGGFYNEYFVDIPDIGLNAGSYWLAFRVLSTDFNPFWGEGLGSSLAAQSFDLGASWSSGYAAGDAYAIAVYDAAGPSPIPVPAAVWLFGTALIGLIGLRRRLN